MSDLHSLLNEIHMVEVFERQRAHGRFQVLLNQLENTVIELGVGKVIQTENLMEPVYFVDGVYNESTAFTHHGHQFYAVEGKRVLFIQDHQQGGNHFIGREILEVHM